jgi:hypothetical protein
VDAIVAALGHVARGQGALGKENRG